MLDDLAASDEECFDETVAVLNGKRCLNALDGMTRYESGAEASRDTSHKVIQVLAEKMDNLVGGSADLSSSDKPQLTQAVCLMTSIRPEETSHTAFASLLKERS